MAHDCTAHVVRPHHPHHDTAHDVSTCVVSGNGGVAASVVAASVFMASVVVASIVVASVPLSRSVVAFVVAASVVVTSVVDVRRNTEHPKRSKQSSIKQLKEYLHSTIISGAL
jgi:membrane protein implicated in regulation of membrane protease activity